MVVTQDEFEAAFTSLVILPSFGSNSDDFRYHSGAPIQLVMPLVAVVVSTMNPVPREPNSSSSKVHFSQAAEVILASVPGLQTERRS